MRPFSVRACPVMTACYTWLVPIVGSGAARFKLVPQRTCTVRTHTRSKVLRHNTCWVCVVPQVDMAIQYGEDADVKIRDEADADMDDAGEDD